MPARLTAEEVEWVVNDNAELGVKIGDQFFFLYKGDSIVYDDGLHDDGSPMHWRTVGKREFGECCHPINYRNPELIGTVSLDDSDRWQKLPPSEIGPRIEPPTASAQPQPERTVRVRIAVAVDGNGCWAASGLWNGNDKSQRREAMGGLPADFSPDHIVWVSADVPLPPTPTTVTGEVMPSTDGGCDAAE